MRPTQILSITALAFAWVPASHAQDTVPAGQTIPVQQAPQISPPVRVNAPPPPVAAADRTVRLQGVAQDPAYGFSPDKPILIGGMAARDFDRRVETYFRLLRSGDGQPLNVLMGEACCAFRLPGAVDTVSLRVIQAGPDGARLFRFYVNGFVEGPLQAPRGLLAARDEASVETIEGALDNLRVGFVDGAIQQLRPLAEGGDTLAEYHLGRILADRRDMPGAYGWFRKAAEGGHSVSQAAVAGMLEKGTGVAADRAAADHWRREAAANGHAGSLMTLALAALSGKPDAAATTRAASMLQRAADLGDAGAQAAYGLMLVQGRGVPRDTFQGMVWLNLAKEAGDRNAADIYPKLAVTQTSQTMGRVEQAARTWRQRDAPQPAVR